MEIEASGFNVLIVDLEAWTINICSKRIHNKLSGTTEKTKAISLNTAFLLRKRP